MAENRGPEVAGVAILFLTLSWVTVMLRCYVRAVMMKGFGSDDWLAVAALILFTIYCTFVLKGVEYGTGQHLANLPPQNIPVALKWWWWCELAYISSTAVLKASIGVFLLRICVNRIQKIIIWAVMIVVTVYSTFFIFLAVFQCHPISYFWTQYQPGIVGKCVHPNVILGSTYAHSAISAAADWILGILPIFLVWNLAMNPRTKVSVALILALGAIGSTATIVRIPYIEQLSQGDFLYSTTDVAIWSTVEPGIGLTAAALATLRPLFRTFLSRSKLFGSSTHNTPKSSDWPASRKPGYVHSQYFRSKITAKDHAEELGLRDDISNGVGITTVIKGASSDLEDTQTAQGAPVRKWSGANRTGGHNQWNESVGSLRDDSSEEFLPFQKPNGDWDVRKTMEVTTSQEIRLSKAARSSPSTS